MSLRAPHSRYRSAAAFWLVLFGIAFANGALREVVFVPLIGAAALPLSGLTGMAAIGVAVALFVRRTRPPLRIAAGIGLMWFVITLMAEAALVIASGKPISLVATAFTPAAVAAGDLFALLVLFVAASPALFTALMRPRPHHT